jgi:hypothetical protein
MQYFKTLGGALSKAFEERGLTDDKGNPITASEEPMTEAEFIEHKKGVVREKLLKQCTCSNIESTTLCPIHGWED